MKKLIKEIVFYAPWWFHASWVIAVALIIAGFVCPPLGVVDNSVLIAVGELSIFALIGMVPGILHAGHSVSIQKGDFSMTARKKDEEPDEPGGPEQSEEPVMNAPAHPVLDEDEVD